MWVLVLILVVLVLFLGLGYARLLSALKDLQEQIQKKLQSGSGVRLTSQVSKKEFQIFETLLAHPKKIFTKEELYEAVWEEVYLPGDNTLNAQLSNLRKKIAQLDPDEDYIETVWGLGVRLKGDK